MSFPAPAVTTCCWGDAQPAAERAGGGCSVADGQGRTLSSCLQLRQHAALYAAGGVWRCGRRHLAAAATATAITRAVRCSRHRRRLLAPSQPCWMRFSAFRASSSTQPLRRQPTAPLPLTEPRLRQPAPIPALPRAPTPRSSPRPCPPFASWRICRRWRCCPRTRCRPAAASPPPRCRRAAGTAATRRPMCPRKSWCAGL